MIESEMKEVVFNVLGHIAPEADLRSVGLDDNLREALDMDSFDFLRFIIGLHESLQVEIPESDYPHLTTLAGILRYLDGKRL